MKFRLPWYAAAAACLIPLLTASSDSQNPPAKTPEALSEAESLRLTVIELRAQLASSQQQLAQLQQQMAQQDYNAAVQTIQSAHPGFALNPQSGRLTPVPKPAAPTSLHVAPPAKQGAGGK